MPVTVEPLVTGQMGSSENELFLAHVPTCHWLLCLPSNPVFVFFFFLGSSIGWKLIMNVWTELERSLAFPVFIEGETEALGLC